MNRSSDTDINIEVRVATVLLRRAEPPLESSRFSMAVPEGTDITGLIAMLGIPADLVGSVTVNGKRSDRDRVLSEGDRVAVVPSISGG